jgi:uncharacterized cupredoxin-like copper-binding protein
VHGAATLLSPMLAAEKSKVPFYVAGGALATWAVIVSVLLGLRKSDFPGSLAGQRVVLAITGVLVAGAISMAVATSGTPTKATPAQGTPPKAAAAPASSSSAASAVSLAADPSGLLSYNTRHLSAKAGTVTITLANAAQLEHNVTVSRGSRVLGATPTLASGSRMLRLTLKRGTYTFYCSVPGHRQAGMEGTLSVT